MLGSLHTSAGYLSYGAKCSRIKVDVTVKLHEKQQRENG
jgi:hypothetical protein